MRIKPNTYYKRIENGYENYFHTLDLIENISSSRVRFDLEVPEGSKYFGAAVEFRYPLSETVMYIEITKEEYEAYTQQ